MSLVFSAQRAWLALKPKLKHAEPAEASATHSAGWLITVQFMNFNYIVLETHLWDFHQIWVQKEQQIGVTYSICDLISDVLNYFVWICVMGKISVNNKILIENLNRDKR